MRSVLCTAQDRFLMVGMSYGSLIQVELGYANQSGLDSLTIAKQKALLLAHSRCC